MPLLLRRRPTSIPPAHSSRLLGALLIAVVTTPIGAIAHLIPHILPFFSPLEGAPTDRANLGGAIGMMGHQQWLRVTSVGTRGSLLFKPPGPAGLSAGEIRRSSGLRTPPRRSTAGPAQPSWLPARSDGLRWNECVPECCFSRFRSCSDRRAAHRESS